MASHTVQTASSFLRRCVDKSFLAFLTICIAIGAGGAAAMDETAWIRMTGGDRDGARAAIEAKGADLSPLDISVIANLDRLEGRARTLDLDGADAALYASVVDGRGDEETAERLLHEALAGYETDGEAEGTAVCRLMLGKLMMDLSRTDEALAHLDPALAADPPAGGLMRAAVELELGRARVRGRDIDGATALFESALATFEQLDAHAFAGSAWLYLSVVSRLQMDLDTTLERREKSLAAFTAAGDLTGMARSQHFIATIHSMRGDLSTGAALMHRAIDLARQAGSDKVLGGALGDLAGVNYLVGNFERALEQYREAGELVADPRRKGWYLLNSASILAYRGEHRLALEYCERARVLMEAAGDQRNLNVALYTAGQSRCELGDHDRGLAKLDEAIAHAREWEMPMSEAYALHYKGHALLTLGRLEEAAEVWEAARELAERIGYFDIIEAAHLGRAEVARNQGDLEGALEHMEDAVATIARVRRASGGSAGIQIGLIGQADLFHDEMIDLLRKVVQR